MKFGALAAALVIAFGAQAPQRLPLDSLPAELSASAPFGLPAEIPVPLDNPFSAAKLALGRKLFFDPILSLDRSIACASCHQPEHGFAEPARLSSGVGGALTQRNAPSLFNRAFGERQMWDGKGASLEQQALLPIENELEMALPLDVALERLRADAQYSELFATAFKDGVTRDNLARALATFVRRLTFGDSPIDRFRTGEVAMITQQERTGMWLWESRAGCWKCHSGPNFTDEDFHATGIGVQSGEPEPGRAAITADAGDRGKFKTPTLRGLTLTAPYMHDGSLATLEEVVDFYARGGNPNSALDSRLAPFEATLEERAALVAFLKALSRSGPPPQAR